MWRFKTEREFKDAGHWSTISDRPYGWKKEQLHLLGTKIPKEYYDYCEIGACFILTPGDLRVETHEYKKEEVELPNKVCIKVDPEECKKVQKELFKLGYSWANGAEQVMYAYNTPYLLIKKDGRIITRSQNNNGKIPEITLPTFYKEFLGKEYDPGSPVKELGGGPHFFGTTPCMSDAIGKESYMRPTIRDNNRSFIEEIREHGWVQPTPFPDLWKPITYDCTGIVEKFGESAGILFGTGDKTVKLKSKKRRLVTPSTRISNNLKIK